MKPLAIPDHAESMSSLLAWVLIDSSVKAAVLLAIALVSTWALRRTSAAMRDRIWTLAFCGALVLPAVSSIVPQWRIPVVGKSTLASAATQLRMTDRLPIQPNRHIVTQANQLPVETNADLISVSESGSLENNDVLASKGQDPSHSDQNDLSQTAQTSSRSAKVTDYAGTLLALWLVGVVVLTVRFVLAVAVTARLVSHCQLLTDPAAKQVFDQTSLRLGFARQVRLLQADNHTIPMTTGVFRPTVVVPANWHTWPPERFRFVLLHELAHVKRLDVLFQSIARLACALYWFNPLAWCALCRMRIDCELACDDQVIATGEPASTYAGELIQIAKIYRSAGFVSGIAMARSSKLDGRIVSLLDDKRPHGPVSKKSGHFLLTLSAGLVVVLAALTVGKPEAVAVEQAADEATAVAIESADEKHTAVATEAAAETPTPTATPGAAAAVVEQLQRQSEEAQGIPPLGYGETQYENVGKDFQDSRTGGICFVAASEDVHKELGLDDDAARKVRTIAINCRI